MPQIKKRQKSLFQSCVEYVVSHMDYYWCEKTDELIETNGPELSKSSFDVLPTLLLESVFENLKEGKQHHYEMLMTPQLCTLNLRCLIVDPDDRAAIMTSCINIALFRCPELKCLKLEYLPLHAEATYLHLCAIKFEELQILDISGTKAGDSCLQVIGLFCQNLKELNVDGCGNISDVGMKALCANVDQFGKKNEKLCKAIEKLNICKTKITNVGAQLALRNFRSLKSLILPYALNIPKLLFEMHQKDFINNSLDDIRKYVIAHYDITISDEVDEFIIIGEDEDSYISENRVATYKSGSLDLAAILCPLVTEVSIEITSFESKFSDQDLLGLLPLIHLQSLEIDNFGNMVTFDGGVFPVLKALGCNLKKLSLSFFQSVNIRAINEYCPKLRELVLEGIENLSYLPSKHPMIAFNNLERFYYDNVDNDLVIPIPSEILVALFSSPLLKEISIDYCPLLTDDVFEEAFRLNPFKFLKKLRLFNCHALSKRGIDVLMNVLNPLSTIAIYDCDLVSDENVQDWREKANRENWSVNVN